MPPQCLKEGGGSVPGGLQVILYGKEGPGTQRDAPEFLDTPLNESVAGDH